MASIAGKKKATGKLSIRCLTLDEKIKIVDAVIRKMSCRYTAEVIKIRKTLATDVIKHEPQLRNEYRKFPGKGFKHIKGKNQKHPAINDILYSWFKNSESYGIYVKGPNINEGLNQEVLNDFKAFVRWLGK